MRLVCLIVSCEDAVHALIGEAERIPDHPALTAIVLYVVP